VRTGDRLNLLLPWLNRPYEVAHAREARHRMRRFIDSFDGSLESGFVRAEIAAEGEFEDLMAGGPARFEDRPQRTVSHDEFEEQLELHISLNDLLRRGFPKERGYEPPEHDEVVPLRSLHFGIKRMATRRLKGDERKRVEARPGAYVMRVCGHRGDLVLFLVMTLLTLPDAIVLERCPVPQPNSTQPCGRWFVTKTGGRPRKFCEECSSDKSNSGRQRHHQRGAKK
jgi:hypothetical protein